MYPFLHCHAYLVLPRLCPPAVAYVSLHALPLPISCPCWHGVTCAILYVLVESPVYSFSHSKLSLPLPPCLICTCFPPFNEPRSFPGMLKLNHVCAPHILTYMCIGPLLHSLACVPLRTIRYLFYCILVSLDNAIFRTDTMVIMLQNKRNATLHEHWWYAYVYTRANSSFRPSLHLILMLIHFFNHEIILLTLTFEFQHSFWTDSPNF